MRDRYASLREGLVGAWIPSVSGSGLLLPDLGGQGNNGTLTNMGPEDWVSSQYGRAMDFDGSDDYVNYGNKNNLANTAFSISFWLAWPATIAQSNKGIIAKWDIATRRSWAITTANTASIDPELNNAGTVVFYYQSNAGSFNASEAIGTVGLSVDDGIWRHFVAVFVPSTKSQWFVNGSLLRTRTTSIPASVSSTTSEFWIGAFVGGFFDGQLDDIRIYNRALSESEIKLLSQEPGVGFKRTRSVFDFGRKSAYLPPTPADYRAVRVKQTEHASLREGLVGAWCPSIEGSGYTLPDLSGNGNNGTLTNMGPEDWVSSQYGRALDFDGVNDRAAMQGLSLEQYNIGISISAWYKVDGSSLNQYILSKNIVGIAVYINVGGPRFFVTGTSTTANVGGGGAFSVDYRNDGIWHYCCAVWSSAGEITLTSDTQKLSAAAPTTLATGADVYAIGAQSGGASPLQGQLDDIRIYNRALSESEIKLLASRPGIGLRPQRRTMYYAPPTGARRRRILTSMP